MIRAALLACTLLTSAATAGETEPPFVDLAFEDALEKATEQDKAVLIDFFTTWCAPCKRLDAETWTDDSVRAWLDERTIPLKIDAEEHEELAKRYKVRGYPTLLFVDAQGEEIERLVGFLPPSDFLEQARLVLDAGSTDELIARRKEIAHESGAPARLEYVGLLLRHERYAEALEELTWCYDVGMGPRSVFRGSRNTRVMSAFALLADAYEPARNELDRRAVALLRKASRNRADDGELHDLSALNSAIDRQDRTLALIDRIESVAPDAPALDALYRLNLGDLLEAGRYEALAERFPPRDALLASIARWPRTEAQIARMPNDERVEKRRDAGRSVARSLSQALEIALGANQSEIARSLEARILELAGDDWYAHHTLAGAIRSATDDPHAALAHARRAVELLPLDDEAETVAPIARLARILHDAGETDDALDLLAQTLATTADADQREALEEAQREIRDSR